MAEANGSKISKKIKCIRKSHPEMKMSQVVAIAYAEARKGK
jgi:hypothetical protein